MNLRNIGFKQIKKAAIVIALLIFAIVGLNCDSSSKHKARSRRTYASTKQKTVKSKRKISWHKQKRTSSRKRKR